MSRPGPSAGSSRNPSAGIATPPDPNQIQDVYRPLAAQIKKPLTEYLPPGVTQPPPLADLLSLDTTTYASRLAGKTFLLSQQEAGSGSTSSLVKGKKRNRGDPALRQRVREETEGRQRDREELGVEGIRKARKRTGGGSVTKRGAIIDYNALKPLYHLHIIYLSTLLNLPPLPVPLPQPLPTLPNGLSADSIHSKLVKADFTGIHLSILSSRCPSLISLAGIVIEETASTFRLVSPDNRVRIIPKDGTQFQLSIPAYAPSMPEPSQDGEMPDSPDMEGFLASCPRLEMTLLGSAFGFRSGDRAGRKFRPAQGEDGSGWGFEWLRGEWKDTLDLVDSPKEVHPDEKGKGKKKRGKARRKDPPAWGALQIQ
ncbi:hypothetical protein BCR39DRAFT_524636 [Naematelia encephala]|uniref:Uncharacterized protein n=1 Tax=Naematelia encephala TaxID=71784 RepID=A0A1Y2BB38_9TREE|nr:hypothetical protein BCR39DRAFT_524636 [Naematelia encephala]